MIVVVALGPFSGGSVDERALQEARIMRHEGWDVTFVLPRSARIAPVDAEREARFTAETGVAVVGIPDWYVRGPCFNVSKDLFFDLRLSRVLERIHRDTPIRLVVTHASTTSYPIASFCRRHRIPSAFVIQALIWDRLNAGANPYPRVMTAFYRHANAHALRKLDWHLANSGYIRSLAIEHGARPDHVRVVYNCIDLERFRPEPEGPKTIDVLYVGRFHPEKGIETLAGAIERLPRSTRVQAVGDGPLRAGFEQRMRAAGCHVTCPGRIPNADLPAVIRSARLQVVPSNSEPQGLVVVEAMACGVPVIGSRVGGIPEMIEDGVNGWLVPARAPEALAAALASALGDPERLKTMGRNALATAARFSLGRLAGDILGVYRPLIAAQPVPSLRMTTAA